MRLRPSPFDEPVVPPTPDPINPDLNAVDSQEPDEFLARELATLIEVDNLGRTIVGEHLWVVTSRLIR